MSETNTPTNLVVDDHNSDESSESSMMVTSTPKSNKRKSTHDNTDDGSDHVNESGSSSSEDVQEKKKRKTGKGDSVVPKRKSLLMSNIEQGIKKICGTIPWIHCVTEGSNGEVEKISLDKSINYYFETCDEFKNCFNFIENKITSIEFVKTHVFPLCMNKLYVNELKVLEGLEQLEKHTAIHEICKLLAQPINTDIEKAKEKIRNATQRLHASVRPIARTICIEKRKIAENPFWLDAARVTDAIFRTAFSSDKQLMLFFPLDEILGTNGNSKLPVPFIFVLSINEDTKSFDFATELAHYMLFNQYICKRKPDDKNPAGHVWLKTQESLKNKQQRKSILKIIKKVEGDITAKFEIFSKVVDAIPSQIYVTEDGSTISRDDIREWINTFCKDFKHPIEKTDYTFGRILLAISKIHHIAVRSHSRLCIGIKNFNVPQRKKEDSEMSTVEIWKALTEKAQKVEDELKICIDLIKELEEQPEVKDYRKSLLEQQDNETDSE